MITAIEAQKRNKDKVNLYLDGEFACSLTAESVVRARLKIGQELSEERLREILATSETELAFKKALDYISRAMKTEKQVKDYLCLKGFDALAAERAVDKLKEYKYADPDKGGDSSGTESLNSPSQRYMGFNLKVNF